jgi:hypothetical protein
VPRACVYCTNLFLTEVLEIPKAIKKTFLQPIKNVFRKRECTEMEEDDAEDIIAEALAGHLYQAQIPSSRG